MSANRPGAKQTVPEQTCTGTFGISRKTGTSSSRIDSIVTVATPAATDASAFTPVTRLPTLRSTRSTSIGLTQSRMMSARSTSSSLEATWTMPRSSARRAALPEPRSVARMRPARSGSARTKPSIIAEAMLPAPIRPIVEDSRVTRPHSTEVHRSLVAVYGLLIAGDVLWSALFPLGPAYRDEFGLSATEVGILLAMFPVAVLVVSLPAGQLADRVGPLKVTTLSALIMAAGAIGQSLAPDFGTLLAGPRAARASASARSGRPGSRTCRRCCPSISGRGSCPARWWWRASRR